MRLSEICDYVRLSEDSAVNNIVNSADPLYVPVPKPGASGKGKKKKPATTDRAMNSLIQTLWFYNNSDAD